MAIAPVTAENTGAETRAKVNLAIAKANQVDSKAAQSVVDILSDDVQAKADYARVPSAHAGGGHSRPGESGNYFGKSVQGQPASIAIVTNKVNDAHGKMAVLDADNPVCARLQYYRIEPNRQYRARFVVKRATDTSDPLNDAVRLGLAWLTASYQLSKTKVLLDEPLVVADGRSEFTYDFPSVSIPRDANYVKPFVKAFGGDGVTYVELIDIVDMTDSVEWSPDVSALQAEMAALQAEFDALTSPETMVFYDDFTIDASMNGRPIVVDSATPVIATLDNAAPLGTYGSLTQWGDGPVTFVAEAGGSRHNVNGNWFSTTGKAAKAYYEVVENSGTAAAWVVAGEVGPTT